MTAGANIAMGGVICAIGLLVTVVTMAGDGETGIVAYGAIIWGGLQFFKGVLDSRHENGPEEGESAAVHPARLISGQISGDDYPAAALRAGEEGSVTVAFDVRRDGRVHDVGVVSSSGSDSLDAATCRLVAERFAYAPAKDLNMNPLTVRERQTITWRLPED